MGDLIADWIVFVTADSDLICCRSPQSVNIVTDFVFLLVASDWVVEVSPWVSE